MIGQRVLVGSAHLQVLGAKRTRPSSTPAIGYRQVIRFRDFRSRFVPKNAKDRAFL